MSQPLQHSKVPLLKRNPSSATHYSTFSDKAKRQNKPTLPMRTTKVSQKLKLFPEDNEKQWAHIKEGDVYTQLTKEEANMVNIMDKGQLFRMTAYCTASAYQMNKLFEYLQSKRKTNGTTPKRFDECLYTQFALTYPPKPPQATETVEQDTTILIPEMFLFDYGAIVFWGMELKEEQRILKLLEPFEEEKLDPDDVETEELYFYYDNNSQPRIYNDIITLRQPSNYLVKLTISHAIAQSVKMTLFERLVDDTINETKYIPQIMAESGNIDMSRAAITKKIGQLFIMRINVNLVSNILDTPEIFWSEPTLEPLYTAMRNYLEISQRVELLNQRVDVISDLLGMLKDHLNSSHGEQLEWIVIWLIGIEIVVAVITTCLDAFSLSQK
ncbi:hypothetical protein G6F70_004420 [Rhizopus microsporus]|uniref:DUF155 domain-containing protein n=2 Tax=Rhizopus TaxID=4842 RepID=A0A367K036_RHIAZ|nr:hypothetical protein G6F71_004450 [Rhizopus microsporus]RCH95564.1 hypothetical protein CU097_012199 [Rhizopus azygosporus]KAG1199999.1 hypothetical protein G6F70_004420 [Rhizopus microsporus]KAG1211616.1 hypothetical protein G6F69_004432 [Rhizopus microsporus]KAG1233596.1 hypothetical protein G6F67_004153 [Rhizopus microsporus]